MMWTSPEWRVNQNENSTLKKKKLIKQYSPVSRFAIIESSPYLALFQIEFLAITPSCSSPRKSHERVVCNFLPSFRKMDTTFGCSAFSYIVYIYIYREREREREREKTREAT
jgi:hypothetical protein